MSAAAPEAVLPAAAPAHTSDRRASPERSRGCARHRLAGARAALAARRHHRRTNATASPPTASSRSSSPCRKARRRWRRCWRSAIASTCRSWRAAPAPGLSGGALPNPLGVTLEPGQVQSHRRHRCQGAHRDGAMRRSQSGHQRRGRALRSLLRARSQQPDRLLDRRQRRRELGRRALPEIRPDLAQRAQGARLHRRRHGARVRQRRARRRRTRPAGPADRQRGHARRRRRGHREAVAQAADGSLHPGQLRRRA